MVPEPAISYKTSNNLWGGHANVQKRTFIGVLDASHVLRGFGLDFPHRVHARQSQPHFTTIDYMANEAS